MPHCMQPSPRRGGTISGRFGLLEALALVLAVLAGDAAASRVRAEDVDQWVGARVMARGSETKLKIRAKVSAILNAGSVFRVERVKGDWLWVDSGNIRGWAKKSDVVLFDEAISYFSGVIAQEPSADYAFVSRGIVFHAGKDYDKAIADYSEAIKLDAKDPWAYHDRAAAYHAKRDFDRALADADAAVRLNPSEGAHLANRASIRFARKEYDLAIADYTAALRLLKGDEASLDDPGDEGARPAAASASRSGRAPARSVMRPSAPTRRPWPTTSRPSASTLKTPSRSTRSPGCWRPAKTRDSATVSAPTHWPPAPAC
jgi:tetratricopeptide (TPR) repeat protein